MRSHSHTQPVLLAVGKEPPADGSLPTMVRQTLTRQSGLPLPGGGRTLERWRSLASLAGTDVCLAKVLEAHYDAQAILAELGYPTPPDDVLLAVWAAEPPDAQVQFMQDDDRTHIAGTKAWCSGADMVDRALLTTRSGGAVQLAAVDMHEPGVVRDNSGWQSVGMARVMSGRVTFDEVAALPVGAPDAYLERPGFWHGGAGIAACWFGGAAAIAETLRTHARTPRDPHARAHLGAIDVALAAAAAQLREVAVLIDAEPLAPHRVPVMRVRTLLERTCTEVIDRVGRALGPGPLCQDRAHALRCADLMVFIRQSHAERDWAALGEASIDRDATWTL